MRTAARITCSNSGLPPTSCNTLGICDFSLVPLPAAIIATATRGTDCVSSEELLLGAEPLATTELPFDFFIRLNISCPQTNGYFRCYTPGAPGRVLQAKPSVDRQNLPRDELRGRSKEQHGLRDLIPAPISSHRCFLRHAPHESSR